MRQRGAPFFVVLMTGALAALLLTQYIRDWDIDTEIQERLLDPRNKRAFSERKPATASTMQHEPPLVNQESLVMHTLLPQIHPTVTRFLADPTDLKLGPGVTIGALATLDTLHAGGERATPILLEEHVTIETGCQLHGPVEIHAETVIGESSYLENVKIGQRCTIEPFSVLVNVSIPDDTIVRQGAILCTPFTETRFDHAL